MKLNWQGNAELAIGDNVIITIVQDGRVVETAAVLVATPAGAGDMWHFEADGLPFALNPYSPMLLGVTFSPPGES